MRRGPCRALALVVALVVVTQCAGVVTAEGEDSREATGDEVAEKVSFVETHVVEKCTHRSGRGSRIRLHYIGKRGDDGSIWQMTHTSAPFSMIVGERNVLPAFSEGVTGLCPGSKRNITVPRALTNNVAIHQRTGHSNKMPLDTDVIFEVEVLDVIPPEAVAAVDVLLKALRGRDNVKAEEVRLAIDHGVPPDYPDTDGRTFLCTASFTGNTEAAKTLLELGADANSKLKTGLTPLMYAAGEGHLEIAKMLLAHNADIHSALYRGNHLGGYTALHFAALQGRVETTKLLLEHGADATAKSEDGSTAYEVAQRFVLGGAHKGASKSDRKRAKVAFQQIEKYLKSEWPQEKTDM